MREISAHALLIRIVLRVDVYYGRKIHLTKVCTHAITKWGHVKIFLKMGTKQI